MSDGIKRDFSIKNIERFKELIQTVEDEEEAKTFSMDWLGDLMQYDLDVTEYTNNITKYHEVMIDKHDLGFAEFEKILSAVRTVDNNYAQRLQVIGEWLDTYINQINSLTEMLTPSKLILTTDTYNSKLVEISENYLLDRDDIQSELEAIEESRGQITDPSWYETVYSYGEGIACWLGEEIAYPFDIFDTTTANHFRDWLDNVEKEVYTGNNHDMEAFATAKEGTKEVCNGLKGFAVAYLLNVAETVMLPHTAYCKLTGQDDLIEYDLQLLESIENSIVSTWIDDQQAYYSGKVAGDVVFAIKGAIETAAAVIAASEYIGPFIGGSALAVDGAMILNPANAEVVGALAGGVAASLPFGIGFDNYKDDLSKAKPKITSNGKTIVEKGEQYTNGRKNRLKSDIRYNTGDFDNYYYETDSQGRLELFETDELHLSSDERLSHSKNTLGKIKGVDDAGHLCADRFGGSRKIDNLVSMEGHINKSTYRIIENEWAKALEQGKKVEVKVKVNYNGNEVRPSSFDVEYWIDGKRKYTKIKN